MEDRDLVRGQRGVVGRDDLEAAVENAAAGDAGGGERGEVVALGLVDIAKVSPLRSHEAPTCPGR
jgi:hypothetical protein